MELLTKNASMLFFEKKYYASKNEYLKIQTKYPEISNVFDINIEMCNEKIKKFIDSNDVYITLTTINNRLDLLSKVIESLLNQTVLPKKIFLNISEGGYLLDTGISKNDPRLEGIKNNDLVQINWVENTGPYRKIIPFMEHFYSLKSSEDMLFITVDDDTLYPEYFIESLLCEFFDNDSVIAFRGRSVNVSNNSISTYSDWSLGENVLNFNNLPTGKDGVIYSTKFFTRDFIDVKKAVDLAPTADDLWIKWHCALNGVKAKILRPEAATSDYKSFPVVDYSSEYRDISLFRAHNSNSSEGKNDRSVIMLEDYFKKIYGYNLAEICSQEII